MFFLLQKEKEQLEDIEVLSNKIILDTQKYTHKYELTSLENMSLNIKEYDRTIPIGTLEFVKKFLNNYYEINELNPIEVPDVLRKDKYLKRKYSILPKDELPDFGYYFLKYVSKLKEFYHIGLIDNLKENYCKDGLYQLSEYVEILSEYRVFVLNDEIQAIQFYNGDCTIFPDTNLIKEMIMLYKLDNERPLAYTMDIAIIENRGTAILEVHPHTSVGLYGYISSSLPYSYRCGIDYYKEHNKKLNLFTNF